MFLIVNVAFADDLAVLLTAKTLRGLIERFETVVNVVSLWCERAGLVLSVEKCQILELGKRKADESAYKINGNQVKVTKSLKYLGVMLDDQLNWNEHLRYIDEKANKIGFMLKKLNWMCSDMSLKLRRTIY